MQNEGSTQQLSINLSNDVRDGVSDLAKRIGRSQSWVIERALTVYLEGEGFDLLAAARGDAEFAAGEAEEFDDVIADLDAIIRCKAA